MSVLVYLLFSTNKFFQDTYTGTQSRAVHRNTKPATGIVLNVLVATLKKKKKSETNFSNNFI